MLGRDLLLRDQKQPFALWKDNEEEEIMRKSLIACGLLLATVLPALAQSNEPETGGGMMGQSGQGTMGGGMMRPGMMMGMSPGMMMGEEDLKAMVEGRASPAPMRIARRRSHLTPWTTPVSMSFAANGDGFIGASRQGSVVTC